MGVAMAAIETTGTVDEQRQLHLDEPLPIAGPSRVRVIILVNESTDVEEQAAWRRLTTEQFLASYNEADEIYDLKFRPRETERVSIEIPKDTLSSLKQVADGRDMSVQALLKFYIGQGLRQDEIVRMGR